MRNRLTSHKIVIKYTNGCTSSHFLFFTRSFPMKLARSLMLAFVVASALVLSACGGGGGGGGGGEGGAITIAPDGEALAYKPATAKAKAGQPVTIKFTNSSTAQQHNLVVVNGGEDVASAVNDAATSAGAPDYLPTGPEVLAGGPMLAPGGNKDITFTAPAAGEYLFICTYPGHYAAGMKGTLTVEP
jgi:plastocyanin